MAKRNDKRSAECVEEIAGRLIEGRDIGREGFETLFSHRTPALAQRLAETAVVKRREVYGDEVFIRGLIEFSNYCRNDCLYCGIRASNAECERYRLAKPQILECCAEGYRLGFRTFVLQSGEDPGVSDDDLVEIIASIKGSWPDCAVTLSIGERGRAQYQAYFDAGAERYLLRHETASAAHYRKIHPAGMSLGPRLRCLDDLREIGYQVGTGFMVGSPFQGAAELAADLDFIARFQPDMCGIGPFIPHHATPFANEAAGTLELTCFALSLIRLAVPTVLLPATTALATIDERGREKGMESGANVVMPNLSPASARNKYELYDNKANAGAEAAEGLHDLKRRMEAIGYRVVVDRGDVRRDARPVRPA